MPPRRCVAVAPLATRWIERLLAGHDPPLTVAQYLALRAIARRGVSGSELAGRTGVSGPGGLAAARRARRRRAARARTVADDRRRQALTLSASGERAFHSAEKLLRERLATLLVDLPRPEVDALSRLLPCVEAALSGTAPPRRHPHRHHPATTPVPNRDSVPTRGSSETRGQRPRMSLIRLRAGRAVSPRKSRWDLGRSPRAAPRSGCGRRVLVAVPAVVAVAPVERPSRRPTLHRKRATGLLVHSGP